MYGYGVFSLFEVIFPLFFLLALGLIVVAIIKSISQYTKNNAAPVLTVDAFVAAKRSDTHQHGAEHHHHMQTDYYVTFQVQSGDRMEFGVKGGEYGMLAEGDPGKLTFQGTRYLKFERM